MKAIGATPELRLAQILGECSFADAYAVTCYELALDSRSAAHAIFDTRPKWVNDLMLVRNAMVRPFGLKTGLPQAARGEHKQIGFFPVLKESSREILLGLDDRHLDFRLVVSVVQDGSATNVTVTTVVRTHNLFGRAYLATIMPFHRVIVRSMLSRAAGRWN